MNGIQEVPTSEDAPNASPIIGIEKRCSRCEKIKTINEFYPHKQHLYGVGCICRVCSKLKCANYREKNRAALAQKDRERYFKNRDRSNKQRREYYRAHKRQTIESNTARYHKRKQLEPEFKILHNLRARLHGIFKHQKGVRKNLKTLEFIGCSVQELRQHLEKQFQHGMTWENYGIRGWHIDHIKQCADFDLLDAKEQLVCFNYKNLQPLWAEQNMAKNQKRRKDEKI